jgi:hypothetical protein
VVKALLQHLLQRAAHAHLHQPQVLRHLLLLLLQGQLLLTVLLLERHTVRACCACA